MKHDAVRVIAVRVHFSHAITGRHAVQAVLSQDMVSFRVDLDAAGVVHRLQAWPQECEHVSMKQTLPVLCYGP